MVTYPDVSEYNNYVVSGREPLIVARATLSTSIRDVKYFSYQAQADNRKVAFAGYHWLNHGIVSEQVSFCFGVVGRYVPLMLDCEDVPGNTGYNGSITVWDIQAFVQQWRRRGGMCNVIYLPRWYWQGHMESVDLSPLIDLGLHLVASDYSATRWPSSYGGMVPEIWQYTANPVDDNKFNGTAQELINLFWGEDMTPEESTMLKDLHDRSNWAETPATQLAPDTPGHPLPGSLMDGLANLVAQKVVIPSATEIAAEIIKQLQGK